MEGGQESQLYQVSEAVIQVSISLFFVHWINEDQSQLMIWLRVCNLLMSNACREIPSAFHALMRIIHKMMNFSAFIFLLTHFFLYSQMSVLLCSQMSVLLCSQMSVLLCNHCSMSNSAMPVRSTLHKSLSSTYFNVQFSQWWLVFETCHLASCLSVSKLTFSI